MKKIGVDIQAMVGPATGLGVYTRRLAESLNRRSAEGGAGDLRFFFYQDERRQIMRTHDRLLWENFRLPQKARKDRVDLLHVPAFAAPVVKPAKLVVTVHDLIGMLFPNQIGLASRFYWGKWLPWSVRKADMLIADSESTKRDIMRLLRVAPEKIRVIYPSGHEGFSADVPAGRIGAVKARFGIRDKYFLFVGTIEPRKNLQGAVCAFEAFRKRVRDGARYQLAVVGSKGFGHGKFFDGLSGGLGESGVIFSGYADSLDLNAFYCGCEALIFPSFYEGFGIPVLEAMACSAPVIASDRSSVPEVAGGAAILVDPADTAAIAEAMGRVATDPSLRVRLAEAGRRRIEVFSWDRAAAETIEVYRSVLGIDTQLRHK
jgi:glycosyltransferase involved in cell wall biosynthesis